MMQSKDRKSNENSIIHNLGEIFRQIKWSSQKTFHKLISLNYVPILHIVVEPY